MTAQQSSADFYRRIAAGRLDGVTTLPIELGWWSDLVVVRLALDLQSLRFLCNCLRAHAPRDGATGEVAAVLAHIEALLDTEEESL